MKNNNKPLTLEHLLYSLALLICLGLRFAGLGQIPLSEFEAGWALQAHQFSVGSLTTPGPNPGYVLLTGLLFKLMGSGDLLARFLPALLGSLLVLWPYALRKVLGREAALILSFGLAIDPGLVSVSRMAGGPMLALSAALLASFAWMMGRPVWTGFLGGLALLSGPGVWLGVLGALLAVLLASAIRREPLRFIVGEDPRKALTALGLTLLFAGTMFLRVPQGLSALGSSLSEYLGSWGGGGEAFTDSLLALVVFQPLGLLFAVLGLLRLRQENTLFLTFTALWAVFALILALAPAGRQVYDLVWALVPLLMLAALGLAQFTRAEAATPVSWTEAGLIFVFLAFIWLDISAIPFNAFNLDEQRIRLIVAGVVLMLAIVSTILIGMGWSFKEAFQGFAWGVAGFACLYLAGMAWVSKQSAAQHVNNLWGPGPATGLSAEMRDVLGDLSERYTGDRTSIEVIYQNDSASLAWALRDFSAARYEEQLALGELPAVFIADENVQNPFVQSVYRGQSFAWQFTRSWEASLPTNAISWLIFRDAPTRIDKIVLWARSDIFPEGSLIVGGSDSTGEPADGADQLAPEEELIPER